MAQDYQAVNIFWKTAEAQSSVLGVRDPLMHTFGGANGVVRLHFFSFSAPVLIIAALLSLEEEK